jgi:hypothetical protein
LISKEFDNNISKFQNLNSGLQCKYTNFYIPVFLTSKKSKITEYGTYDKYVIAKSYICKFLEYKQQCHYLERFSNTCHLINKYSLIAERFVDLFPFNELADTKLIKSIKEGKLTEQNIESELSSINIPNSNTGMTPLIYSIIYKTENNIDKIKLIIDKGADISYNNIYDYRSVLLYTIEYNRFDITDLLLSKGATINDTGNDKYMSQLMIAIIFNLFTDEQVKKLFALKPNINYIYKGKTALDLALYYSKLSFIGPLVNAGADTKSGTEESLVFRIFDILTKNIKDDNVELIENTIIILIKNVNIEDILKSSNHLLITNQHLDQYSENKSKIITILFKLMKNISIYRDERINIFHLYILNTKHNLEINIIKDLYLNCQIKNRDLTNIKVYNIDFYKNFVNWINEHKLYVDKIDILENNTTEDLIHPEVITTFNVQKHIYDESSDSEEEGSLKPHRHLSYESMPVSYDNLYDFPKQPLIFFNLTSVNDSIII